MNYILKNLNTCIYINYIYCVYTANDKFITSRSFLSSDLSYRRVRKEKESDELLYTVWVTRYGPQSSCQRNVVKQPASNFAVLVIKILYFK